MAIAQKKLLGESLVQKGLITEEQLRQAELEAGADAKPLRKILPKKGLIGEEDLTAFLSQQFDLPLPKIPSLFIHKGLRTIANSRKTT